MNPCRTSSIIPWTIKLYSALKSPLFHLPKFCTKEVTRMLTLCFDCVGQRSNVLQKVEVSVVDNETCRAWFLSQGKKVKIKDTQLCAGHEQGGKDACRVRYPLQCIYASGVDLEILLSLHKYMHSSKGLLVQLQLSRLFPHSSCQRWLWLLRDVLLSVQIRVFFFKFTSTSDY